MDKLNIWRFERSDSYKILVVCGNFMNDEFKRIAYRLDLSNDSETVTYIIMGVKRHDEIPISFDHCVRTILEKLTYDFNLNPGRCGSVLRRGICNSAGQTLDVIIKKYGQFGTVRSPFVSNIDELNAIADLINKPDCLITELDLSNLHSVPMEGVTLLTDAISKNRSLVKLDVGYIGNISSTDVKRIPLVVNAGHKRIKHE